MQSSNETWFSCCNARAAEHGKWQDMDPRTRTVAQNQISIMMGEIPFDQNKRQEYQTVQKRVSGTPSTSGVTQKLNNTRNVVNSIDQSIIHGKFDDMLQQSSLFRGPSKGKQVVTNNLGQQRPLTNAINFPQNVYPRFYQPQVIYPQKTQTSLNNISIKRL